MSSLGRSSGGQMNNDLDYDTDDLEVNNNHNATTGRSAENPDAWWTVGEFGESRKAGLTHQSAKLTLTGNKLFGPQQPEEVWDLTDSLADLYEQSKRRDDHISSNLLSKRQSQPEQDISKDVNIQDWLADDPSHGFIRVYPPSSNASPTHTTSQLVPCSLSTSAHRICLMLGVSINALHVQLNGDVIRRLDPYEHPLVLQNDFLSSLGYTDLDRIQQEGTSEELAFLIRFYAGKPMYDSTFSRNQLQALIEIKKSGVLQQWTKRLCVISGTRLLIYKDKYKRGVPSDIQLAKGSVEEVKFKGHDLCLKLTSTVGGEKITLLSFNDNGDYNKWYRKCKKATDKLPTAADLSHCHLEFLPENLFINEQLAMLNLRHNVLRERPLDEDIYTIGWLDDLSRFSKLRSLNLANNCLVTFPMSLCQMKTLVELNIASNKLTEIPTEICSLTNLQALHLHNNHLTSLPAELVNLRKLFILVLAFNHFTTLPPVVAQMTNVRVSEVENIIMSGNQIEKIPSETLMEMKYAKKVYLRMNCLTLNSSETMRFTVLEHVTHLDLRDNQVSELDVRALKTLEYLNVERNDMVILQVNGVALKNLFAAHNCIEKLTISPKPEWLLQIDVSFNCLTQLPEWLSDCFFLQKLWASHNIIMQLPLRLFAEARKLKSLRVDHNRLVRLPAEEIEGLALEELHLHHNLLITLPQTLLIKANRLRMMNLTKNRLSILPPLNDSPDLNKVQELYLSGNCLGDGVMQIIAGYPRLKVLHLAQNEIYNLFDSDIKKLETLIELNVSSNQLRALPAAVGELSKLVILRAHSNCLQTLPDLKNATSLKILDVGHNQLLNVSVTHLMASQLDLLDMSLNAQLKVDPREFKSVKNKKSICLVDLTGQNRVLPGLKGGKRGGVSSRQSSAVNRPASDLVHELAGSHLDSQQSDWGIDLSMPWKVGFVESNGMRNNLCVKTLKILNFGHENEALFGMFDGGHNKDVPSKLSEKIEGILRQEQGKERTSLNYLKYTMLTAHRSLGSSGQRLGASTTLCHMLRMTSDVADHDKQYMLHLANVGDVEAVLCRRGEALLLTRKFVTTEDRDECQRVYKSDGIITEDNKVNGTTKNTRMLGCGYLHPHIIPDPYTNTMALRNDDEFIIIANRGLWRFLSYEEAVEEVYETGNPVVAAKQLLDLAQGYGSRENMAILVIRLNTDRGPSLARLRQHHSMSVDDVVAAALHEAKLEKQKEKRRQEERKKVQSREERRKKKMNLVEVKRNTQNSNISPQAGNNQISPQTPPTLSQTPPSPPDPHLPDLGLSGPPISFEARKHSDFHKESSQSSAKEPINSLSEESWPEPPPPIMDTTDVEDAQPVLQKKKFAEADVVSTPPPPLKPLPNHRYLKKDTASEWGEILQTRLSQEVKDLEMKQLSSSVISDNDSVTSDKQSKDSNKTTALKAGPAPEAMQVDVKLRSSNSQSKGSLKRRTVATPWTFREDELESEKTVVPPRAARGSIAQTIALFEKKTGVESDVPVPNRRSISVPRERVSNRDLSPASPALKKSRSPPPPPSSIPQTYQLSLPRKSRAVPSVVTPHTTPSDTPGVSSKPPAPKPPQKPRLPINQTPNTQTDQGSTISPKKASHPLPLTSDSVERNIYTVNRVEKSDTTAKPNVSALVKMFGTGKTPDSANSDSIEVEHVDDDGSVHVFEIAKL